MESAEKQTEETVEMGILNEQTNFLEPKKKPNPALQISNYPHSAERHKKMLY